WIGAIFGALFGWIGILVAALFWATLAIFKLLWALTLFAAQLIIGVSALIARATVYLFNWASRRMASPGQAPRVRKAKDIPAGLKPRRTRHKKGAAR
ncbi:MAG: hypothetical protein ACO3C4_05770, partial [Candidatus Limnocylindrus sp.]